MKGLINLIHIIPDLGTGGAEKLVIDLCKNIDKEKINCKIVSLYSSNNTIYEKIAKENSIEIEYLNKRPGLDISIVKKIIKIIKKSHVDVIHTHLYVTPYVYLANLLSGKKKWIHTVHNIAEKEFCRGTVKFLMKYLYRNKIVVPIAISKTIHESIRNFYNISTDEIRCIYNGIDTTKFVKSSYNECKKNKEIQFIHVGRFNKQKNHRLLVRSFNDAIKVNNNIKLKLIGDGELRKEVQEYVNELGLKDNIEFKGIKEDIPLEMNSSDVFILSSDWEGLPISILEAMSCGLPIISTDAGGVKDIVNNNYNGIIVDIGDYNALTKAILEISKDSQKRLDMGIRSKEISTMYDIKNITNQYQILYQMLTQ